MVGAGSKAKAKKIVVEVEVPEGEGVDTEVEKLLELLRKGVPLNVGKEDLRRTKIYDKRSRH